jgi:hypothetical protein
MKQKFMVFEKWSREVEDTFPHRGMCEGERIISGEKNEPGVPY